MSHEPTEKLKKNLRTKKLSVNDFVELENSSRDLKDLQRQEKHKSFIRIAQCKKMQS